MLAELSGMESVLSLLDRPFLYSSTDKLKLQHADKTGQDSSLDCWKEQHEARLLPMTVAS